MTHRKIRASQPKDTAHVNQMYPAPSTGGRMMANGDEAEDAELFLVDADQLTIKELRTIIREEIRLITNNT